jgi:hypothetical protein
MNTGFKAAFTPIKAIRLKCRDCNSTPKMVKECQEVNCPLHPYRLGTNPRRKGIGGNPQLGRFLKKRGT